MAAVGLEMERMCLHIHVPDWLLNWSNVAILSHLGILHAHDNQAQVCATLKTSCQLVRS